jgi:hypothetical protein
LHHQSRTKKKLFNIKVAEATFISLRKTASENPSIHFVAVSHSTSSSTDTWLEAVGGPGEGSNRVTVLVDPEREIYAKWGMGTSSWMHVLSPSSMMSAYRLGKDKGIWNRPTESGSRWQSGGNFAVDGEGVIKWGGVAGRADEVVDFADVVKTLSWDGESKSSKL